MAKFRYRKNGGAWTETDADVPFAVPGTSWTDSVDVEAIGEIVTLAADILAARAQAIIDQAAQPLTELMIVMTSPPTRTEGALNAASTVNGNAIRAATYMADDAIFDFVSQPIYFDAGANQYRVGGKTQNPPAMVGTYGYGVRFLTNARYVELDILRRSANRHIIYVTDTATGVRQRAAANDYLTTANDFGRQYERFDFGSQYDKLVEVYFSANNSFWGLNIEAGATIAKPARTEPRIGVVGDSWMDAVASPSNTTTPLKNTYPDWFAWYLGCTNFLRMAHAGTGWLNSNGQANNHLQRGQNGDFDAQYVGDLDLVWCYTGVNDHPNRNAAFTDVAVAANVQATVELLMVKQPNAIIAVPGPQWATGYPSDQARYDAIRDAVLAAGAGDPRVMYIDNSPAGENWINATNIATLLGPDALHPGDGRDIANIGAASLLARLAAL